jgi:hypothetical protein
MKVVDPFKTMNLDIYFASFGFFMKKLWAVEVGLLSFSTIIRPIMFCIIACVSFRNMNFCPT